MDIQNIIKNVGPLLKRNSSTILTGLGVAGSVGSLALGVKATPGALRKLDTAYLEKAKAITGYEIETPLTKLEVVKVVWRDYLPAAGLQVLTVSCVIGAQAINKRKQAALISAFGIVESGLREYQERMAVEAPAKDRQVRDDMAKAAVDAHPTSTREVLLVGNGDQIFYEADTDRYFMSTMQKVQKAANDLNFRILNQEYASVNEWYSLVGLRHVKHGDDRGWTPEQPLELDFSTQLTDKDEAAIVINYIRPPYDNAWKVYG